MRIVLALLAVLACAAAAAADLERGRAVWNYRCYFCHGYSGDGRTVAATFLSVPPRDFQAADPREFPPARIVAAIRAGIPGTAMKSFDGILTEAEITAVAAFLRSEFLEKRATNTRYHTPDNGWPDHERYREAFGFARGEIALDADDSSLTAPQRRGRTLFLSTCITCHDRARGREAGPTWERVQPR